MDDSADGGLGGRSDSGFDTGRFQDGCDGEFIHPRMPGTIGDDELLNKGMDTSFTSSQRGSVAGCQGCEPTLSGFQLLFPQIDSGAALTESLAGGVGAILIKEVDYLEPVLNFLALGMVHDVAELLHTATIPPAVITFYIYLLQFDSSVSPPRESNMFLNLCIESYVIRT